MDAFQNVATMTSRRLDDGASSAMDEYLSYNQGSDSERDQSPVYDKMLLLIFVALLVIVVGYGFKMLLDRRRGDENSEAEVITDSFEIPKIEERPSWTTIDKPGGKGYAPPAVEVV